jgi:hypothetical protein
MRRPAQGKGAEGPYNPRELQHLLLRRPQAAVFDLLRRVTTVSVRIVEIVEEMRAARRFQPGISTSLSIIKKTHRNEVAFVVSNGEQRMIAASLRR